ncbi:MAG: hypothetical protein ACE5EB_09470 [Thermodesulfobacteriota bacterium]
MKLGQVTFNIKISVVSRFLSLDLILNLPYSQGNGKEAEGGRPPGLEHQTSLIRCIKTLFVTT